ncbi:MAG: GNAT family acetyltransferase [Candidatus Peregrinibacteria bacterium Greene0416_19]|nr:MAG: GNAT family acetyltransferase [Candidatus Peregrinibacteria bacterium Greene0416_19]
MGLQPSPAPEREPPHWQIDHACSGDGPGIVRVQKEAWLATYPDPAVGLTREDIEAIKLDGSEKVERWEAELAEQSEGKRIWVVRAAEGIIGFCVAEKTQDVHELRAIYVLPEWHGNSVGAGLMAQALEWLGHDREVVVWVFTHNKRAIDFYQRRGFEITDHTYWLDVNGKRIPDVKMVKPRTAPHS